MRHARRPITLSVLPLALVVVVIVGSISPSTAGAGKGSSKPAGGSSTIALVLLDSPDSVPNHGERITFSVTTTATAKPYVLLRCYQGGVRVLNSSAGYFDWYPFTKEFVLRSTLWGAGAAECTAVLHHNDARRTTNLATLDFTVAA